MDTESAFSYVDGRFEDYRVSGVQWEAYSDGGCRGTGVSAFSWIVYAVWPVGGRRQRFTVAMGYETVKGNYSSFITELWGLERAVETLDDIITG